jgi:hypothetical protein
VRELALSDRDKAKEIEEKHHVTQRAQRAASSVWQKAKEAYGQNRILERTKALAVNGIDVLSKIGSRGGSLSDLTTAVRNKAQIAHDNNVVSCAVSRPSASSVASTRFVLPFTLTLSTRLRYTGAFATLPTERKGYLLSTYRGLHILSSILSIVLGHHI